MKPAALPVTLSACRRRARAAVLLVLSGALLAGCGAITLRTAAAPSTRNLPEPAAPAAAPATVDVAAEGLKLARLLRDQGRFEGAARVYAQLDARGDLKPLELLEYASVAAQVQSPGESLALYGRARRTLRAAGVKLSPAAAAALEIGIGRARMALGQTDAALGDFDAALAAAPDATAALNAKGVLLDVRGDHAGARRLLQRAIELDPSDWRSINNLALSHLTGGDTDRAIALLAQAEVPQQPTLKLNLAFALALRGDAARARQTLLEIMTPEEADHALADFAARRGRIQAGASIARELLAASHQWLPLGKGDNDAS